MKKDTKVVVNGIQYNTLIEPYEIYKPKASFNTVRQRFYYKEKYGWTDDEIFELVPRVRKERAKPHRRKPVKNESLVIDGVEYKSKNEAARAFDKEPSLVHNRISAGMSLEEACKKPLAKVNPVVVKGKEYRSPMKAFHDLGTIPVSTYQSRRRSLQDRGLEIEDHIEFCIGLTNDIHERT